ncbi:unnamed protein product [Closterium sp. NIES-64]|nr:unnamed protein product [Closterium sp. NIES-64]
MEAHSLAIARPSQSSLPPAAIAARSNLVSPAFAAPSCSPPRLRDPRRVISGGFPSLSLPYSLTFARGPRAIPAGDRVGGGNPRGSSRVGNGFKRRCVCNSSGAVSEGEQQRAGNSFPLLRRGSGRAEAAGGAGGRRAVLARSYRWSDDDVVAFGGGVEGKFEEAVALFNEGQFYKCAWDERGPKEGERGRETGKVGWRDWEAVMSLGCRMMNDGCHDLLEEMWHQSAEPQRGMLHGLLQCAVGMVHLLNQNHSGAMMEFGEGVNKLRRAIATTGGRGPSGSFAAFEAEAGAVLEFIYNTQLEHAACSEVECVTMDGSAESYSLLGDYGAGQQLYRVHFDPATGQRCLEFCSLLPFHQAPLSAPPWQQSFLPPPRLHLPADASDLRADADDQRGDADDLRPPRTASARPPTTSALPRTASAASPTARALTRTASAAPPTTRALTRTASAGPADDPRADADGQRGPADDPRADADCQRGPADEPRADADSQRAATKEPRATADGQRAAVDAPAPTWTAGAQPRLICPPSPTIDALELLGDNSAANWHSYAHSVEVLLSSVIVSGYTLRSVVFQEEGGLQPIAPSAPTGPPPDEPGPEPESPGDPPSFAPDVNNPQSVETAIRAYRNTLNDHLRRQLRYEDDKRAYDEAAARHRDYHAQLTTYTTRLASYTSDIAAWRIADRRALAILLATIPSSLKRKLSPTSSSHLWQLLVDLFDRQDIATLYALIKDFGSITMDSTAGAAAFTRRVLDLARRLAALGKSFATPPLPR